MRLKKKKKKVRNIPFAGIELTSQRVRRLEATGAIGSNTKNGVINFQTNSMYVCMYVCMDQPGKVANPARGQLNRENE